jgi:ATP-binding cassette, subfamily B, bacterial
MLRHAIVMQSIRRDVAVLGWRAARGPTARLGVAIVVGAVGPMAFILTSSAAVGELPKAIREGLGSAAGTRMTALIIAAGVVFVLVQIASHERFTEGEMVGQRIVVALRNEVLRVCTIGAGVDDLADPGVRDELGIVVGIGRGQPLERAPAAIAEVTVNTVSAAAAVVVLMYLRLWIGLAVGLAYFAIRSIAAVENGRRMELLFGQATQLRRAQYLRQLALAPAAAKELRVFQLQEWLLALLDTEWTGVVRGTWRARRSGDRKVLAAGLVFAALYCAVFSVLLREAASGRLSLEAFAIYVQALIGAVNVFGGNRAYGLEASLAPVAALRRLEERRQATRGRTATRPETRPPMRDIALNNVRFAYPNGPDVLRGLQLKVKVGESVALVGANGAGKTTALKLLAGFYPPISGSVLVDGVPLSQLDGASWRKHLAMMFQGFVQLPLTLAENVHFLRANGSSASSGDEVRARHDISECLDAAGLGEKLRTLPDGLHTVLGRSLPGGVDLSSGEWQRVALARVFFAVRRGATVLLLDEPTASVDVEAEQEIFDRLLQQSQNLTRIVVSHRFSTVRRMDRIVVVDDGRVLEDGPHDALMARHGSYRRMFLAQAAPFAKSQRPVPAGGQDSDEHHAR